MMMRAKTSLVAALVCFFAPGLWGADIQSNYWYQSTISSDANGPLDLLAELNYDDSQSAAPIAVVMHGYSPSSGNLANVRANAQRLRNNGFFAISVAMRGRDGSDGIRDSGGVEIYDIYDAVEAVKADPAFSGLIDPTNVHITGYSGGGGNTMSALTKFPDYFRVGAAFFGMSDYGYDLTYGWYNNGAGSRTSQLNKDIGNPNTGGNPVLDRYLARASNLASKNNPYSEIHLFVNSGETICPPWNMTSYRDNAVAAASSSGEFNKITVHIGGTGVYQDFNGNSINEANELQSWPHGFPNASQQDAGELWYRNRLLSGAIPQPVLNNSDTLRVAGFVKTSKFECWLGDGKNAAAELTYSLTSGARTFGLQIVSSDTAVTGRLTVDTTDLAGREVLVKVNGVAKATMAGGGKSSYSPVAHNDTIAFIDNGPAAANYPPSLYGFSGVVDSTTKDTEVEITFNEIAAAGNAADGDGTVQAFVVKAVSTGTLKLGTTAGSATGFAAGTNDTISATTKAYWKPAAGAIGSALNAFTLVAKDDDNAESTPPVQATVEVTSLVPVLPTVGIYDEDLVNADTVDAVSPTSNNSLTLSDLKTRIAGAFAANLGGVWNFDTPVSIPSGEKHAFSYGTSQTKNVVFTITGGTSFSTSIAGTCISGTGNGGQSGSADRIFTTDTPLTLVAVTVVDRGSSTVTARLVATLQDNTTIETTASASNTDTLHVLTASASNPIVSFKLDQVAGTFARYDDLAFEVVNTSSNTFANWISDFEVGTLDGVYDDADGDGINNATENFFGTFPNQFSRGLQSESVGNTSFTFTHPQGTLADDLTATYRWSTDLTSFHPPGATVSGTTVTFSTEKNTPSEGITTVTANISGTLVDKLFVDVQVKQN